MTTDTAPGYDHLIAIDAATRELLFTAARSANTFTDEPVTDEQLRAITELAKWPPTSDNISPLRIVFIRSPEGKERLRPFMSSGNRDKTMTAPAVAILAVDTDFHEKLPELFPDRPKLRDDWVEDPEVREWAAKFNGTLQAGYFILAIRAAGLAAGPMLGFKGPGIDAEFFADRPWKTILLINIGRPGENAWFPRLPRLRHDDYVEYL